MNIDHIIYIKMAVESNMLDRSGNALFAERFFEVPLSGAEIEEKLPCACMKTIPKTPKKTDAYDERISGDTVHTDIKKLYETTTVYELSFFTKDIYDHVENTEDASDLKTLVEQLIDYLIRYTRFTRRDGRVCEVEIGIHGSITNKEVVTRGIYKSYLHIIIMDGIYSTEDIPKVTGATISQGGSK